MSEEAVSASYSPQRADATANLSGEFMGLALAVLKQIMDGGNPGVVIDWAASLVNCAAQALECDSNALTNLTHSLSVVNQSDDLYADAKWNEFLPETLEASLKIVYGRLSMDRRCQGHGGYQINDIVKKVVAKELEEAISKARDIFIENAILRAKLGMIKRDSADVVLSREFGKKTDGTVKVNRPRRNGISHENRSTQ